MGLDIGYFSRLVRVVPEPEGPLDHRKHVRFRQAELDFTETHWPGFSCGLEPGVYAFVEFGDFSVGPYSCCNEWRGRLARFAFGKSQQRVWFEEPRGPFAELVHFADDDGVIGATPAAKLGKDFAAYDERAGAYAEAERLDDEWLRLYRNFRKAFEIAADGAAVLFY